LKNTGKKHNTLLNKVKTSLNDLTGGIVVGLSGGPDSVCLLSLLSEIFPKNSLIAVHVNHMLRTDEADLEQQYCNDLCNQIGIEIAVFQVDIRTLASSRGVGLEECGRDERYRLFEQVRAEKGFEFIAVAHNQNDQAETILMNIARGTGIDGLKGMEFKKGRIIRPLLGVWRDEIERYCIENELLPKIDSSNLSLDYTRNKVRLEVIPALNKVFDKDVSEQLVNLGKRALEDSCYLQKKAQKAFEKMGAKIDCKGLLALDRAIANRVIRKAIESIAGSMKDFSFTHIESIYDLASSKISGKTVALPTGIEVHYAYGLLEIRAKGTVQKYEKQVDVALVLPGATYFNTINLTSQIFSKQDLEFGIDNKNKKAIFLDFDKINSNLVVRNRRNGDIIYPFHSNGTKKLKEYLIDKKTPQNQRDKLALLACENEVIWIIGEMRSKKYLVTEVTEKILKIEIQ